MNSHTNHVRSAKALTFRRENLELTNRHNFSFHLMLDGDIAAELGRCTRYQLIEVERRLPRCANFLTVLIIQGRVLYGCPYANIDSAHSGT